MDPGMEGAVTGLVVDERPSSMMRHWRRVSRDTESLATGFEMNLHSQASRESVLIEREIGWWE